MNPERQLNAAEEAVLNSINEAIDECKNHPQVVIWCEEAIEEYEKRIDQAIDKILEGMTKEEIDLL